jgi:hypothetical protein
MQQNLFDVKSSLYKRFIQYHKENPMIYHMFKKYTIEAIQSGYKHFGSQMIIEKIRWETGVVAKNDKFKIGNDYASFYSRMFMLEYPHYKDYFRIRCSYADELNLSDF